MNEYLMTRQRDERRPSSWMAVSGGWWWVTAKHFAARTRGRHHVDHTTPVGQIDRSITTIRGRGPSPVIPHFSTTTSRSARHPASCRLRHQMVLLQCVRTMRTALPHQQGGVPPTYPSVHRRCSSMRWWLSSNSSSNALRCHPCFSSHSSSS